MNNRPSLEFARASRPAEPTVGWSADIPVRLANGGLRERGQKCPRSALHFAGETNIFGAGETSVSGDLHSRMISRSLSSGERVRVSAGNSLTKVFGFPPRALNGAHFLLRLWKKFTVIRSVLSIFVAALIVVCSPINAQEPAKKTLFLPKSATAAAYVLGRLSNQELMEAPRSEFVYVALLQRKGLDRKYRVEALDGLVKIRGTDSLAELLAGLEALDNKGEDYAPVLRDLAAILLQAKPGELSAKRDGLEKLTADGQLALTRQIAFAALVTADASGETVWKQAQPERLVDLIRSIEWVRDPALRASFYPRVEPLIHLTSSPEMQLAAISAITAIPGHEAETFKALASLTKSGTQREAAIAGLQSIPRKSWPKDEIESLTESLVAFLKNVPVDQRTSPEAVGAFQLATDLTGALSPEKAGPIEKALRSLGVSIFVIRTISEQMLYDKTLIVVEPGKPVQIILINEDAMPHNLVVVSPGAWEEIGEAAEKMPPTPDAEGRLYVPDSPKVLHATKLVESGQQIKLSFTAPPETGEYPYVCTFPGHWRRMVGTLVVVKDIEAYLASNAARVAPKITEWKIEDLLPELEHAKSGRNLARGKELFTQLACAGCHKLGAEGIHYGPEVGEIFKEYKNDRVEVLRQIIEPSLIIRERYRNVQFELKNGDEPLVGMIVEEEGEQVTIQTGPSDALIQTLKKSEIIGRVPQKSSSMPGGLLNALSKDEILDLLIYLETGGKLTPHQH